MERIYTPPGSPVEDAARTLPMYALPHHLLSRIVHWATRSRFRPFKDFLITRFKRSFRIKLHEALEPDARVYESFNAFFTRGLRPDARPVAPAPDAVASPVDGTVSQAGRVTRGRIFQAKGQEFSVVELLGGLPSVAAPFFDGSFVTLYLAPRDYHRIHMPYDGVLKRMTLVPGRLFPVNPPAVRRVPRLFARNERVVSVFDTDAGPMAVVSVGALFVGSIEAVWHGEVTPPHGRRVAHWTYDAASAPRFPKGAEIGRFNMGSTVILLFGTGRAEWHPELKDQTKLQMGEEIGRIIA